MTSTSERRVRRQYRIAHNARTSRDSHKFEEGHIFDEGEVLSKLGVALRNDILQQNASDVLLLVPLFHHAPVEFFRVLSRHFMQETFTAKTEVISEGALAPQRPSAMGCSDENSQATQLMRERAYFSSSPAWRKSRRRRGPWHDARRVTLPPRSRHLDRGASSVRQRLSSRRCDARQSWPRSR